MCNYRESEQPARMPTAPPPPYPPAACLKYRTPVRTKFNMLLYNIIFVWDSAGNGYWMYPIKADGVYLYGYIWDGSWRYGRCKLLEIKEIYA
jgi:hypothetical protein